MRPTILLPLLLLLSLGDLLHGVEVAPVGRLVAISFHYLGYLVIHSPPLLFDIHELARNLRVLTMGALIGRSLPLV